MLTFINQISEPNQARSQDLKKGGGGGFFESARQLQATLTQSFIVLETESHGFSESEMVFQPKNR